MHTTNTVNGVDVDRLSGTIDAVTANPALARFQFRARNHWIDGGLQPHDDQGLLRRRPRRRHPHRAVYRGHRRAAGPARRKPGTQRRANTSCTPSRRA